MVASELSPEYRASIAEAVEAIGTFTTATKELRECYSGRRSSGSDSGLYRPISAQSKQSAGSGGGTASRPGKGLSHQVVSSTRWRILQPESVRTSRSW